MYHPLHKTVWRLAIQCSHKARAMVSVSTTSSGLAIVVLPRLAVIGIGLFFSVFMVGLTAIQSRYTGFSPKNSEEFNSASRSVKPGLIASGIVSAWTWAATLVRQRVST